MTRTLLGGSGQNRLPQATHEILYCLRKLFNVGATETPSTDDFDRAAFEATNEPDTVVYRMVLQNAPGKEALANLYIKYAFSKQEQARRNSYPNPDVDPFFTGHSTTREGPSVHRVFLESGSTLLYVANELRKQDAWTRSRSLYEAGANHPDGNALFVTCTNNNLAAHLFLSGDPDKSHRIVPYLFPGFLEPKYEGLFGFYPNVGQPNVQIGPLAALKLAEERVGYAQSRLLLANCHLLLLAASRVSLIHGPIVGSRENAMFKNACYNACVRSCEAQDSSDPTDPRQEIQLFVTVDKLVAHTRLGDELHRELASSDPHGVKIPTVEDELDRIKAQKCFPVFDIRGNKNVRSPFGVLADKSRPVPLRDGTRAPWLGDGYFRVCDTWPQLFEKADLRVQVFVSYQERFRPYLMAEVSHAQEVLHGRVCIDVNLDVAADGDYSLARIDLSGAARSSLR